MTHVRRGGYVVVQLLTLAAVVACSPDSEPLPAASPPAIAANSLAALEDMVERGEAERALEALRHCDIVTAAFAGDTTPLLAWIDGEQPPASGRLRDALLIEALRHLAPQYDDTPKTLWPESTRLSPSEWTERLSAYDTVVERAKRRWPERGPELDAVSARLNRTSPEGPFRSRDDLINWFMWATKDCTDFY